MKGKLLPLLLAYAVFTTIGLIMMLLSFRNLRANYDEITVKRINIVDNRGHNRLVIANEEMMPPPIVDGKISKRTIRPAGILFYNEMGTECGGIAVSKTGKEHLQAVAFDYSNFDAIGILSQDSPDGKDYKAGIIINDKKVNNFEGNTRLKILTQNGNAGLLINDPKGRPRISLMVDSAGRPDVRIMDKEGKVVKDFSDL